MIRHAARSRPESEAGATGSNRQIQLLSTENMCKSFMRLAEARARRSVLLRDKSFISMDVKCSSDSCERAFNITQSPQGGTAGVRRECNLLAPLRKLTTSACLPIDCPASGE